MFSETGVAVRVTYEMTNYEQSNYRHLQKFQQHTNTDNLLETTCLEGFHAQCITEPVTKDHLL